jgi:hypothetical protein
MPPLAAHADASEIRSFLAETMKTPLGTECLDTVRLMHDPRLGKGVPLMGRRLEGIARSVLGSQERMKDSQTLAPMSSRGIEALPSKMRANSHPLFMHRSGKWLNHQRYQARNLGAGTRRAGKGEREKPP